MSQDEEQLLISIPDTQFKLGGVSRATVYRLVSDGQLTKVSIGTRGFITTKSIAAYVNRLAEAATA